MSDFEIKRLCAEAMGVFNGAVTYDPLHDDAQAMALVKLFGLLCDPQQDGQQFDIDPGWEVSHVSNPELLCISPDLNRAICECVAKMASKVAK